MKNLYKDDNVEIVVPENFNDIKTFTYDTYWCTRNEVMYDLLSKKMNYTFYDFIYSDGYVLALVYNKSNSIGYWIDNVKTNNKKNQVYLHQLGNDIFNIEKMREIAINKDINLDNIIIKISEFSDEIKNIIKNELTS